MHRLRLCIFYFDFQKIYFLPVMMIFKAVSHLFLVRIKKMIIAKTIRHSFIGITQKVILLEDNGVL